MKIGVGLPSIIPGTSGRAVIEWGREAERLGFSSIATIGRLTFPALEELVALSAVAAVTDRIELITNTLIAPARDAVELAKQAASLDNLSNGRFTLGIAAGWREDDFTVTGRSFHDRGRRFDEDLEAMTQAWAGERVRGSWKAVSPKPVNGTVPMVFGGTVARAFERVARWGIGWTAGGGAPDAAAANYAHAREVWTAAGREGAPRLYALAYYAAGEASRAAGAAYLTDYYGDWGGSIAAAMPVTDDELRARVKAFEEAGADVLILDPTSAGMEQLEGLARAVLS